MQETDLARNFFNPPRPGNAFTEIGGALLALVCLAIFMLFIPCIYSLFNP